MRIGIGNAITLNRMPGVAISVVTDTTPDAFTFTDVTGATLSTVYTSNTITVAGIDAPAAISIAGGTYSINGGAYVATSGTVNNGDTVSVRVTSSASNSTASNVVLTIGGVVDTYTVTTVAGSSALTYTLTGTASTVNAAFSGPATHSNMAIGSAAANRRVIALLTVNSSTSAIAVTIGGVTATIHVQTGTNPYTVIASAIVPTGTTANVVISNTTNPNNIGNTLCNVGTVYGANATTPVSATGFANSAFSERSVGPLTVPTGGVGVIVLSANWNAVTLTGTGVVTDAELDAGTNGSPCAVYGHASATFTATSANSAGNGAAMAAAVFQP